MAEEVSEPLASVDDTAPEIKEQIEVDNLDYPTENEQVADEEQVVETTKASDVTSKEPLQEPYCPCLHTLKDLPVPLTDKECSTCYASPVVAGCTECASNPSREYYLCAGCSKRGTVLFRLEMVPEESSYPYGGQRWTGTFIIDTLDTVPATDARAGLFGAPVRDLRCNIFNKAQNFGCEAFRHPNADFSRLLFVCSLTSGVDDRKGESNRIGCNGGGFHDDLARDIAGFGWLNSGHWIEGFGTYEIKRTRIQDLKKKMTPREEAVLNINDALKNKSIEWFGRMVASCEMKDLEAKGTEMKKDPKRPVLNAKAYATRKAKQSAEWTIKKMFSRNGLDWEDFKFGKVQSGIRLEMDDIIFGARMMYSAYLTSVTPITKYLDARTVQQFVDPRWESLEQQAVQGKTLTTNDVPVDLQAKFDEYFWLKFMLTFFDQRLGQVEPFGTTRSLMQNEHNALKMVEMLILEGSQPIIADNVELFVAQAWWSCGDIAISFQGTTDERDRSTNFNGTLIPWKPFEDQPGQKLQEASKSDVAVHEGYYRSFLSIRDQMMSQVEQMLANFKRDNPTRTNFRIGVYGHSMGGALAAMTTAYLTEWLEKKQPGEVPAGLKIMCQTYGQPKIGNAAFVRKFESHKLMRRIGIMSKDSADGKLKEGDEVQVVNSTVSDTKWTVVGPDGTTEVSVSPQLIDFQKPTKHRPCVRILRVFDLNDVVPTLPPVSLGYQHMVGESAVINADGDLVFVPARLSKRFDSASAGAYRAFVNRIRGVGIWDNHNAVAYKYKVVQFVGKHSKSANDLDKAFQDKEYFSRVNAHLHEFF